MKAITLFIQSLKSTRTQEMYLYELNRFCRATFLDHDKLLEMDPRTLEEVIIQYLIDLRKNGKSYLTRQLALAAIKHFLAINDVSINHKKIGKFLGERVKTVKDRAYTREEIAKILSKCDERKRVLVLLLASSGIRIGATACLKLRHLKKREDNDRIYQITVYENSKEECVAFRTPECT